MSWILGKKEREIVDKVLNFLDVIGNTLTNLREAIKAYLDSKDEFQELAEKVRVNEHRADDLRRQIESTMYGGAFLPNFRGDLLGIIESADKVANKAEYVADMLEFERPFIPQELRMNFLRILDLSIETYEALKLSIYYLFEDLDKVGEYVLLTEQKEHEVDVEERKTIKSIFASDIPYPQKLHLKELVRNIADIADRAEDCSDRVEVVSLKRRV
ncbi:TIGR00153 family protein [Pseudothermotoga thermarum]|uniref:Putative phosphate transport regulator n=1 Tax=Pseudothermotoga thermarum DSM 5069 TaxID=688269 RepID=F7YY48_9THEM|nr:TIGR00153 family protein [Pseudothermotoga thermarum]AEH50861.1 putative phosphate transport regulator [Pseudothermotoga thermarum DSM 5069]